MALGKTTYRVSTILGTGTPTSADVDEAEVGAVFLDKGGRVLTKSETGNLMLIAEANAGSLSRPIVSTSSTRPSSVLAGEWWKSDVGNIYLYDGTNDLPISDSGLNENDKWVDITDITNPKIMIYHATGSLEENSSYVLKTGDTMTGNLLFSKSSYIGDVSGSVGINTNGNIFNIETNNKGIVLDTTSSLQIKLFENAIDLIKDANGTDKITARINQYDGGGELSLSVRDSSGNIIGTDLVCRIANGQDNNQWVIGNRTILTKFTQWDNLYFSDEYNSRITGENFYGDTSIGIGGSQAKVLIMSEDVAIVSFIFILNNFSKTLPLSNTLGYFEYDVNSLLTKNNISTIDSNNGIILSASYVLGENESGNFVVRTPAYECPSRSWGGGKLKIYTGDARATNGNNYTCTLCKVFATLAVKITRTGR
jgi:hypothetical protein